MRIPWPHGREPCVVGKWAAAGMVGQIGGGSPGGLGGVSLLSRGC